MSGRTCELLEPRRLLSAVLDSFGHLSISATPGADIVGLSIKSSRLRVGINNELTLFSAASVNSISIDLGDGNDYLTISPGVGSVYVLGGLGDDTIFTNEGNDTVTAGGGRDFVSAGAGDDRIDGGPGRDTLAGDDGADRIYGGDANDVVYGLAGVDRLYGDAGNDYLSGGSSNDKLYGDDGDDTLLGGNQHDLLIGGLGDDSIRGNDGNDTIIGQQGNDRLFGDKDDDLLFGDDGADLIDGGNGNDQVFGLAGEDTLHGGDGDDSLDGGAGNDTLRGHNGLDSLDGGDGNDALYGGFGLDTLAGGAGADRLLQRRRNNDDSINDFSSDDAVLTFIDRDAAWTDDEIEQIDAGLGWMHQRTSNTKLLKRFNGAEVALLRVRSLGSTTLAINIGDGRIEFADLTFDLGEAASTIAHEMGHHWDTVDENPGIKAFFDISRWRKRVGVWTYDTNSQFASEYGKTNPYEDFATSFEVYFSRTRRASLWQAKWDYMDAFFTSLTT